MFDTTGSPEAAAALARLRGAVDGLLALPCTGLTGADVLGVLRELETEKNRLAVADHQLIAHVESLGVAREHACRSTASLLSQLLRVSPSEATGRVRAAADLGPRRSLTGEALPPVFERVAAAQASGAISATHARVITQTIDDLPVAVQAEHEISTQVLLVDQAHLLDPRQLAHAAHRLRDTLDPDGTLATERDRHRRRELTVRHRSDGSAHVDGELSTICTEALLSALDSTARPEPAQDGEHDPRTPGQRRHDGLQDALLSVLRSGQLPHCNGVAATILITITAEQAGSRRGTATTGHGAQISVNEAFTLVCDARILPVLLNKTARSPPMAPHTGYPPKTSG